jgi:asparagine synthase (glutamine-hydrolysing)
VCGICGIVGRADQRELQAMTDTMAHRGPDGSMVKVFGGEVPAGLGHRRLAIIDPSPAGAQPMGYRNRWWITYNGELYNFRELRRQLELEGERFETSSDTEVLLRMFALYGPSMLERLNGIYALAIWDDETKRLFLARDRLGVKPLYYTRHGNWFAFASEVRALLPLWGRADLEPAAIADVLTFLWVPEPRTAFRNIHKLPAGHFAWVDRDGLEVHEWWDLSFEREERSEAEWTDEVRAGVTAAVQRQMVSDVPLGSFLSGGIDSSAIVAAMAAGNDRVSTWSIGYSEEDLAHEIVPDDLEWARKVGSQFGVDYHEHVLHPDVLETLPKAIWHLEDPIADPAAISTYLICREAREQMPVMLSGMGGDEVFAGYPRYLAWRISRTLAGMPRPALRALERAVGPFAKPGSPGRLRGPRRNLWKFMRAAGLDPLERYLSFSSYYARSELDEILAPGVVPDDYDVFATHRSYLARDHGGDELARILYLDTKTFLPSLNLAYTDKMGMAASVEVRVPLLDDEIVALAARIPSNLKLRGWRRKYIFKKSQEGLLADDVIWRRKAGFGAPVRAWLVGDLAPLVDDLLSEQTLRSRGFVDPAVVARLRADNAAGRADNSLRLYALLTLELWCRTFLDRTWTFDVSGEEYTTPAAATG